MALKFRDNTKKDRIKKSAITFGSIFVCALVFFSITLNFHRKIGKQINPKGTLPILSATVEGKRINEMHGYRDKMDTGIVNSNLIPVSDGELKFNLEKYKNDISDIRYELCDEAGKKVYKSGKVSVSSDGKNLGINLKDRVKKDNYYMIKLSMEVEDRPLYFYTKIYDANLSKFRECVDYANGIQKAILSKDQTSLSMMEPQEDKYTDSLATVNIHSSLPQITWKNMNVKLVGEPVLNVNAYYNDTAEITYRYTVADEKNSYNVREYMKVKNSDKLYLLDYQRYTEEVFKGTSAKLNNDGLSLGIVSDSVSYASNKTGRIVAFVNNGRLFEYNQTTGKIVKVFDFGNGQKDARSDYWQHDIRILSIGEGGSLDFAVYGYMNSGTHEGRSGISFFKYDSSTDSTTEQVFSRSDMPFEFLKIEYSDTMYRSRTGSYNIMSNGSLFEISASGKKIEKKLSGLQESQYKESSNGRFISWTDKDEPSSLVHTVDLENGRSFDYKAGDGEKIIPLLYIGQDFIFGRVRDGEKGIDEEGNEVYPMHEIDIADVTSDELKIDKKYPQNGYVVTEVIERDSTLYLRKANLEDGVYKTSGEDVIKNTFVADNSGASVTYNVNENKGRLTNLTMTENIDIQSKKIAVSNIRMRDLGDVIKLPTPNLKGNYYVVVGGHIMAQGDKLTRMIESASEFNGSVVSENRLVWSSTRKDRTHNLEVTANDLKEIKEESGKGTYVKLNGLELKNVLYFVAEGHPVYVETKDGEYLIVGYDTLGVNIYNPATGVYETVMQTAFGYKTSENGNVFKVSIE